MTLTLKGSTVSRRAQRPGGPGLHASTRSPSTAASACCPAAGPTSFDTLTVKTNDGAAGGGAATWWPCGGGRHAGAGRCRPTSAPVLQEACVAGASWRAGGGHGLGASRSASSTCRASSWPTTWTASILVDVDAAGNGWFVDRTPGDDREFADGAGVLVARAGAATGRMDLLSVLEHELGHAAGLEHTDDRRDGARLAAGTRTTHADGRAGRGTRAVAGATLAPGWAAPCPHWRSDGVCLDAGCHGRRTRCFAADRLVDRVTRHCPGVAGRGHSGLAG
jgi:hypothetical protein